MAVTIRTTMTDIISELRRKVYDYQPEELDSDVYPPGKSVRFTTTFYNTAGTATTPSTNSAKITIYDPDRTVKVSSVTMSAGAGTGIYYYDYTIPSAGPVGTWRRVSTATVSAKAMTYSSEFKVKSIQRVWTDEELQRVLDRHRVRYTRETVTPDWNYLKYTTNDIKNLEEATLYTEPDNSGTAISTSLYTTDLNVGEFTFTVAQNTNIYPAGSDYPGYDYYMDAVGHNIFAAAEELLLELMADPSRASSWSRGSVSHTGYKLTDLVRDYRAKSGTGFKVGRLRRIYDG
jgi:hypothetical protein